MHYIQYLQDSEKSASIIKTDLAAIRFFHDKIRNPKYALPSNSDLDIELERRCFGDTDRTRSSVEFNRMPGKAIAEEKDDFIPAFYLARYAGLRIHECFRIDTAIAEQTLCESFITINGKGGKIRTVPINEPIRAAIKSVWI